MYRYSLKIRDSFIVQNNIAILDYWKGQIRLAESTLKELSSSNRDVRLIVNYIIIFYRNNTSETIILELIKSFRE
jgi:hypothetical protein